MFSGLFKSRQSRLEEMASVYRNPYDALVQIAQTRGQRPGAGVLRLGSQVFDDFHFITWAEILARVRRYGAYFRSIGIERGDRVGLMGRNGLEWVCADWACFASGVVSVPLYTQTTSAELHYIIRETEMKALVCDERPSLAGVDLPMMTYEDLEQKTATFSADTFESNYLGDDEVATIIYTSGTSGDPKGVMHSSRSIMQAVRAADELLNLDPSDRTISYLPLSHIVERVLTSFFSPHFGPTIYFLDKIERLPQSLTRIRPTILVSVPRIWDLIRFRIEKEMDQNPLLQKRLQSIPSPFRKWLVGYFVRRKLGVHQCRAFISGAAKLSEETADRLKEWGIDLVEGYGLTETMGVSSANRVGHVVRRSVGKPFSGVSLRIADDGEICLKASFHFLGYFKKPQLTSEVVRDGWFFTGDLGRIDENGYLYVTDRKKNIFKNSGGKYVAPLYIEGKLKTHRSIREVCVLGADKPYCVALATIDPEQFNEHELEIHLDSVNQELAPHERVKTLGCLFVPWTVDSGEMTATQKMKRRVVEEKYKVELSILYSERRKVKVFGDNVQDAHSRIK